jgi:hypothetical protein
VKKVVIRPVEDPSLEEKVSRLRVDSFPYFPEVHDFGFYTFVYHRWWGSSRLADELHRWAAVTDEGEVVGHLSALPQYYRIDGRRVVAHTPADYMIHPRYGFYALSLMRTFFRTCENGVACDMVPATIDIETRLGFEAAGQLNYALKLLNVSRLPVPPVPAPARRLLMRLPKRYGAHGPQQEETTEEGTPQEFLERAPAVRPRLPLPAPVKGLLNGGLRLVDEALSSGFGSGLEVEVLKGFDASFDELFERIAAAVPCVAEKDAAFLRWRYGPGSPQAPVTVLGVAEEAGLLGYAVLKVTEGMDGYILDLTALPGRRDVTRALTLESVRFLRRAGAQVIRYRYQDSTVSARPEDLQRLGFFFRKGRRNTLLTKFSDPGLHETARRIANWSYTLGDGEASFWMR